MIELIQLERRKPEDVRLVRVMPGLLDALSREKQILERLGASNATFRDYSGFRDFLQRLSEEQPPVLVLKSQGSLDRTYYRTGGDRVEICHDQ